MNAQKIFEAVKAEPDQPTLLVVARELEQQVYTVTIAGKYGGFEELEKADENGELTFLPTRNGVIFEIQKEDERQQFRVHLLDLDVVCLTSVQSHPVIFDPKFTTDLHKAPDGN
jgi:hypothetical protein